MNTFLEYELKTAIALVVFTLFYKLLLQKETFHRFNRMVLLITSFLAFILPFCVIVRHETVTRGESHVAFEGEAVMEPVAAEVGAGYMDYIETGLAIVFFLGAALMLFRLIYSIGKIRKLIAGGRRIPQKDGTTLVIVNDNDFSPVSWMKYIVMSEEDYSSANEGILIHERAHIALGHSWDILVFDLMAVMQWFNPAIWLLKADLRAIHEYEADEAVITAGTDMREYQLLLVRKAVATVRYQATNSLNHSTLKNRIKMMSSKKSSLYGALKALYVLPLVAISLMANAETRYDIVPQDLDKLIVKNYKDGEDKQKPEPIYIVDGKIADGINHIDTDRIKSISVFKDSKADEIKELYDIPNTEGGVIIVELYKEGEERMKTPAAQASFDGGDANRFSRWLSMQLIYPEEAKREKAEGTVTVQFTIDGNGSMTDIRIAKNVHKALGDAVLKAISSAPKWTPAPKDGNAKLTYILPVHFDIRGHNDSGQAPESTPKIAGEVLTILDDVYVTAYLN